MTDRATLDDVKRDLDRAREKATGESRPLPPIDGVARVNEAAVAIALSEETAAELRAAVSSLERSRSNHVLIGEKATAVGERPEWRGEFRSDTDRAEGALELALRPAGMTTDERTALEELTGGPGSDVSPADGNAGADPDRCCSLSLATSERVLQGLTTLLSPIDDRPWYLAFALKGTDGPPRLAATPLPPAYSKEAVAARGERVAEKFDRYFNSGTQDR